MQGSGAPMGPSASALHSRLQALRDVTNKKSAPPSGKDAAGKQRLEASAAATFEPSLTNSRAAATAERAVCVWIGWFSSLEGVEHTVLAENYFRGAVRRISFRQVQFYTHVCGRRSRRTFLMSISCLGSGFGA